MTAHDCVKTAQYWLEEAARHRDRGVNFILEDRCLERAKAYSLQAQALAMLGVK